MTERVIELPNAAEAGRERDAGDGEVGFVEEPAREMHALGACHGERAGAQVAMEQPAEMP